VPPVKTGAKNPRRMRPEDGTCSTKAVYDEIEHLRRGADIRPDCRRAPAAGRRRRSRAGLVQQLEARRPVEVDQARLGGVRDDVDLLALAELRAVREVDHR